MNFAKLITHTFFNSQPISLPYFNNSKRIMKYYYLLLSLIFFIGCKEQTVKQESAANSWAMLNFVKVDSLNPILQPDSTQHFNCPIGKQTVNWEERNVLNPSAVVKDGVVLWGQVGVSKTLTIGENAVVFAQSGVPDSIEGNRTYFGTPVEDALQKKKELVWVKRIPEMWEKLKNL